MPHNPTRRRAARAAALLFATVAAELAASGIALAAGGLTARENSFVTAVNSVRARHSVPPVSATPRLVRAARSHSAEMIRTSTFTHGAFLRRLVRFGVRGPVVGEDLGWTVEGSAATSRIVSWWLASPRHRSVLLRPGFRHIGIGVARGPFFGRRHCIVVTADFEGR
jgi:uncharacterized protein YkwD